MEVNFLKYLVLAVSILIANSLPAMQQPNFPKQEKSAEISILSHLSQVYGTMWASSFFHELGHWSASKLLFGGKGIFWVSPTTSGRCILYEGKLDWHRLKTLLYINELGRLPKNPATLEELDDIRSITHKGIKGVGVASAGPILGMAFSVAAPMLATVYQEYKKEHSFIKALKNTKEKDCIYEMNTGNLGIIMGAWGGLIMHYSNLLPIHKALDGYKILDYLKMNKPVIRGSVLGAGVVIPAVGLYSLFKNDKQA